MGFRINEFSKTPKSGSRILCLQMVHNIFNYTSSNIRRRNPLIFENKAEDPNGKQEFGIQFLFKLALLFCLVSLAIVSSSFLFPDQSEIIASVEHMTPETNLEQECRSGVVELCDQNELCETKELPCV